MESNSPVPLALMRRGDGRGAADRRATEAQDDPAPWMASEEEEGKRTSTKSPSVSTQTSREWRSEDSERGAESSGWILMRSLCVRDWIPRSG
ncbi:hypothetical protein THAOC_06248, partial [Thalassiosira oceanica]